MLTRTHLKNQIHLINFNGEIIMKLFNEDALTPENLENFCNLCHEAAKNWWINLETNEPLDRNRGEMIALKHSELSEAWDGFKIGAMDDHLPHRLALDVEIADACIRLGDYTKGTNISLQQMVGMSFMPIENPDIRLLLLEAHSALSKLLEAERKGKETSLVVISFFLHIYRHRNLYPQIDEIIVEKMEYNANRADHKIENRLKDGGKKI